jgi:PAS domain S-box-containing protein
LTGTSKLLVLTLGLAALIFYIDLNLPLGVAGGVPYVAVVLLGWWAPKYRHVIYLAVLSSILTIAGYYFSPPGVVHWVVSTNRGLALFAIWVTAFLVVDAQKSTGKTRRVYGKLQNLFAGQTKELRESEARYRDLAEGSLQGILIHDGVKPIFANQTYADIFGYKTPKSILKEGGHMEHVSPKDRARLIEYSKARLTGGQAPEIYEFEGIRKDGTHIKVENRARVIAWKDGTAVQRIIIDVTDRVRAMESMRAAKEQAEFANRAKTEFLAHMSHELRTPLNAILGYSHILKTQMIGPLGNDKYTEYAGDINAAGEHLIDIIGDILDIAMVEASELEIEEQVVDLSEVMEESRKLVEVKAITKKIDLKLVQGKEVPQLYADPRRLKQIFINLLINAIKFTPKGGWVKMNTEISNAGGILFRVSDNGIGIAAEDIPKVLNPFSKVSDAYIADNQEGVGLGLSLVKSLARLHDAELLIESSVGSGTEVTVTFPMKRAIRG